MRTPSQRVIDTLCFINYEGVASTSSIAHHLGVSTSWARKELKKLAGAGYIKRHPYSCSNGIKWMVRRN